MAAVVQEGEIIKSTLTSYEFADTISEFLSGIDSDLASLTQNQIGIDYSDNFEHGIKCLALPDKLLCQQSEVCFDIIESKTDEGGEIDVVLLKCEQLSGPLYLVTDGYHTLMHHLSSQARFGQRAPIEVVLQRADLFSKYCGEGVLETMLDVARKRNYALPRMVEKFSE